MICYENDMKNESAYNFIIKYLYFLLKFMFISMIFDSAK